MGYPKLKGVAGGEGNSAICLIAAEVGSSQPLCYGSQQLQVEAATTDLGPE